MACDQRTSSILVKCFHFSLKSSSACKLYTKDDRYLNAFDVQRVADEVSIFRGQAIGLNDELFDLSNWAAAY